MTDQTPPAIADSTVAPEPAAAATEPVPIAEPEPVAALPAAVEPAPAEPVAAVPLDAPRHGSWSRPGRLHRAPSATSTRCRGRARWCR